MPWEAVQSSSLNVFVTRFGRFMGDQISEEVVGRIVWVVSGVGCVGGVVAGCGKIT